MLNAILTHILQQITSHTYYHAYVPQRVRKSCTIPMYTHSSPRFRSHVIGGEPIATNRAQILTPNCYWEFHEKTQ